MKHILILDNSTFSKLDIIDAFQELDYATDFFYHEGIHSRGSQEFRDAFDLQLTGKSYQFVFSLNYYPELSNSCERHHIPYIAYVYDCPLVSLFSYSVINSCNHIFVFDKAMCQDLWKGGITTIHYLPMAANVKRLSTMVPSPSMPADLSCDVSFVGSLYNEDHNLYDSLTGLSDYTSGYLDAIMTAQLKVSGYFFIEELLTPDIIKDLKASRNYEHQPDGVESEAYVYANYFIARKLAEMERTHLLDQVSQHCKLNLYTHNPTPTLPLIHNLGPIDYYNVMPIAFKSSKINLNISLRSIRSGMPLRVFDILGCGAFLLSNYQADFFDYFTPGEDYDYYEDDNDLLNKIEYYLSHDKERQAIAANAYEKIKAEHTYTDRIKTMLTIAGLC